MNEKTQADQEKTPQKWGLDARQFVQLQRNQSHDTTAASADESAAGGSALATLQNTASTRASHTEIIGRVSWRPREINFDLIPESAMKRSLHRLQQSLPVLIWNAAALEGSSFTLPQVQTLLDGVTVSGKRIEEAEQILALSDAMQLLVEAVTDGTFALTKTFSDRIHGVVAQHEAIESGKFRGEGMVTGGGVVRLAAGGTVDGDTAGPDGDHLKADYANLLAALQTLRDPRARALVYFASATRSQFYFDGNKRTARIMMTGALIQAGYEPINVPFARREEFNEALDELFRADDATSLLRFLTTCVLVSQPARHS